MFSLARKKQRVELIMASDTLKGSQRGNRAKLLLAVPDDLARTDGHKIQLG